MNKIYLFSPVILMAAVLIFISSSSGVASQQGKDRTGSPLSTTGCVACHTGGNFDAVTNVAFTTLNGDTVGEYEPEQTYLIRVAVTANGASKYGFQLTAMDTNSGKLGLLDASASGNAKIVGLSGVDYAEHTSASAGNQFIFQWIAPASGKGDLKIYAAGLAANGNGMTSGDQFGGFKLLTISESGGAAVASAGMASGMSIYPNPVNDVLNIGSHKGIDRLRIYSLSGELVIDRQRPGSDPAIDVSKLKQGVYVVEVNTDDGVFTEKIVKL